MHCTKSFESWSRFLSRNCEHNNIFSQTFKEWFSGNSGIIISFHSEVAEENNQNHAAAMELAPSRKKEEMDFDAWAMAEAAAVDNESAQPEIVEEDATGTSNLLRIRVIQSIDEPIITADGEINLGAGDVLFLDEMTANYLIDSGVAESASL